MANPSLFIRGEGGNVGQDLKQAVAGLPIDLVDNHEDAEFVALCVPSHVATEALMADTYHNQKVIDFSGAAKRNNVGEYGLMIDYEMPWRNIDVNAHIFGNPSCIASAVLLGMRTAKLKPDRFKPIQVFSVGGKSYAHTAEDQQISLARRLYDHPHIKEIQKASYSWPGYMAVSSFMPVITGGVDSGLFVGVSGQCYEDDRHEEKILNTGDVVGSGRLDYRLEIEDSNFSLGVVIDNLRFVTNNAVRLIDYLYWGPQG